MCRKFHVFFGLCTDIPATQSKSNQSPQSFSRIWEYFKLLPEIFGKFFGRGFKFVTQRLWTEDRSPALAGFFAAPA